VSERRQNISTDQETVITTMEKNKPKETNVD